MNLVSPLGGPKHTVLDEAGIGVISWMPDGRALIMEMRRAPREPVALWALRLENGELRQLTWPPEKIEGDAAPAVSPDGRTLAFCRVTAWRTAELYLLGLEADAKPLGSPRKLTDLGYVANPAWTPDSNRVVFEADRDGAGLWQLDRDGRRLRPVLGVPESASSPSIIKRPGGGTSLVFSNITEEQSIWRYDTRAVSTAPVELVPSSRSQRWASYSPDGKSLAFSSDRNGYEEIWVSNADGSHPVQLTDLRNIITEQAEWSPAGDAVAFVSQHLADRQIYLVSSAGGPAKAITNEKGVRYGSGWSRDGTEYYYTSERTGRREVWKASRSGETEQVTFNGGQCGIETARGVFYWTLDGTDHAPVRRVAAGGDQPVSLGMAALTCPIAPSPRGFYFRAAGNKDIYLYDDRTGRSSRLFAHPRPAFNAFTISPDGRWFATDTKGKENADLMIMEHFR